MSSVYNLKEYSDLLDGGLSSNPNEEVKVAGEANVNGGFIPLSDVQSEVETVHTATLTKDSGEPMVGEEISSYEERSRQALMLVDDIVLKNYLSNLDKMDVIPVNKKQLNMENIILFKINKMVYERDEYATDKFISVVSAMTFTNSLIYLIVDGHKDHTDFYLGVKCEDDKRQKSSVADTFRDSILGQFPGAILEDYSYTGLDGSRSRQDKLLNRISEAASLSSCVGVPSYKNSKGEYTNATFIQGIEKFTSAMQGKEYTAVIIASNLPDDEIKTLRDGYETVYTELSAMASRQLAYSTNESLANAISRTKGTSDTHTISTSVGESDGITHTDSKTDSKSNSKSTTKTKSRENLASHLSKGTKAFGGAVAGVGMALSATGIGAIVGVPLLATGGVTYLAGGVVGLGAKNKSKSKTETHTESKSYTTSDGVTHTTTTTATLSDAHTDSFSETNGETSTVGTSKNFTITIQNKHIAEIQKKIDKQLERIEICEGTGMWSTGAYFLSYDTDRASAEIAATVFRSIMQGEQSGVETSAINTWYPDAEDHYKSLMNYVGALSHPVFEYHNDITNTKMLLQPTSLLSSKEVAILLGLPRKSVPGLPVIEHVSMGKEVVRLNTLESRGHFQLGCIYDQGVEREENKVMLDAKSLTQHTFVTGSTGCGKSNTIYYLINQIRNQSNAPKFLIIEPAKGEYKDVFGNEHIYGTNPLVTPLLRINPFRFPEGVHVLEHIDRIIEIFNVCWPMYAAMPAVLKEAILNAYEACGWDLYKSKNSYSNDLFPSFADLLEQLVIVINNSAYSEEVKSNYRGSLVTRVKSLNNGLCKQIFSSNELGDMALFDENVIVDLSRIGSQETKSLIMGILIMRLNEYRANSNIPQNSDLRHITILEEAHNILKNCSHEQRMEGSNVAGKSVEMISNAIAEMRTYGEGFIIVDQSPGAVDISAIRNTNTKIIMRLPEDNDRKVAGKASGMRDNQIDEIAKLPTGVAVVYQNDWEEPVLCKIGKFCEKEIPFKYICNDNEPVTDFTDTKPEILKLLLRGRLSNPIDADIDLIDKTLSSSDISTANKLILFDSISEYKRTGQLRIWKDSYYERLSRLVTQIISVKPEVRRLANTSLSYEELTGCLRDLVSNKVYGITDEMILATSQCIMKDYSLDGDSQKKIYRNWYNSIRNKQLV